MLYRYIPLALGLLAACTETKIEPAAVPTYHKDIAPILSANCSGCHSEGGIAPFTLASYADAKAYSGAIAAATRDRVMPPFIADNSGDCNTYQDARWLTDAEIDTIGRWAAGGAPKGDQADEPALEKPSVNLLKGESFSLQMTEAYTPNAELSDDYRCFVLDAPQAKGKFLTGYELTPGDKRMVHHMLLFSLETSAAVTTATQLDTAAAGSGYTCFGGPKVDAAGLVAAWAPGGGATNYPEGTGIPLATGKLVMQIHYNTVNGVGPDQTAVKIALADQAKELGIDKLASMKMQLDPGSPEEDTSVSFDLLSKIPRSGVTLYGIAPHMHTLGTKLSVTMESEGEETCFLDVKRWDFHWQQLLLYQNPLTVERKPGSVTLTCTYDTSERTSPVTWGEGTEDEMCLVYFFYTVP